MRILYVVGDPSIRLSESGGHIRHITECVRALGNIGHEVRILTAGDEEKSGAQKKTLGRMRKFMPAWMSNVLRDAAKLSYDARFGARIEEAAADFQPDFVYNRHAIFHRSGVMTGKKMGIPTILEVNAIIVQEADRYFGVGLKSRANKCEGDALREASAIVVVSEKLKDALVEYGVPANKVYVNPNGADPEKFNPAVDASPVRKRYGLEGKVVVGFLGSMVPWHGVPNLLEAARVIGPKQPDVRFLIVGPWDEADPVVKKVKEYGLEDKVIFTGAVPLDEAPVYIRAMDIATAPYADPTQVYGSSTKFYEYMATGRATIASRLGQMADVIEDGVTGMLVKPGDSGDLTEKILYLLDRPELREEMGVKAREVCLANFTWQRNADRIIDVYRKITAEGKS